MKKLLTCAILFGTTSFAAPSYDRECMQNILETIVTACVKECNNCEARGFTCDSEGKKACKLVCKQGGIKLIQDNCQL